MGYRDVISTISPWAGPYQIIAGIVWYSYKEAVGKIYLDSNDLSDRQTKFAIIYKR